MVDYSSYINQAALKYGVSPSYLSATVGMEGTPNNLFGFQGGAATAYGFNTAEDFLDIGKQFDGGAAYAKSNAAALQVKLGRAPTEFETYLAHWQGSAGAFNILTQPFAQASDTVKNYWNNGGASLGAGATNADWIQAGEKRWLANGGTLSPLDTSGSILGNVGAAIMGGLTSGSATGGAATVKSQTDAEKSAAAKSAETNSASATVSAWGEFITHQGVRAGVFMLGTVFIGMGLVVFTMGGARANVEAYREFRRARSVAREGRAQVSQTQTGSTVFVSSRRPRRSPPSSPAPAPAPAPRPRTSGEAQHHGAKPHSGSKSMRMLRATVKRHANA
jgi:hypothetical protein